MHDTCSPYATGGGGTVLEHRYGATLLAHLLTGDPISLLGDDVSPIRVMFQNRASSPVDDIVVTGRAPDGRQRRLSIGVRRSPAFVPSNEATVKLLASYLRIVHDHWTDVAAGDWRLALAAAGPNTAMQQVSRLAHIARAAPDEAEFRAKMVPLAKKKIRDRLKRLDEMVALAGRNIKSVVPANELTWRLLSALWPVEIYVEGAHQRDRTGSVSRLCSIVRPGTVSAADTLFRRLTDLVGDYAPAGAVVTEAVLRRDLAGFSLARSPLNAWGWSVLERLAGRLRDRTGSRLIATEGYLEIDRTEERKRLRARLQDISAETGVLIVRGDPDVGKSALTLRVVEELSSADAGVVALSLRDLPSTMVEFESALSADLTEVLAGAPVGEVRLLVVDGAEAAVEGRLTLLTDLATASLRAGLGVVAVTRADGVAMVADGLVSAQRATGRLESRPPEHEVPALDDDEIGQLTTIFTGLTRLAEDPRSAWVLSRPGLVDLLLRSGVAHTLPDRALSEADVFAAIWWGLVRRATAGSSDAREHTLLALARRLLFPGTTSTLVLDASALPSLRSDGLLLPLSPTSAWNRGEEFASDLVRDLAVARLFLVEGWSLLTEAKAPRWALRAARLACQVTLVEAGSTIQLECLRLDQSFRGIAEEYGQRWGELPFEALLTLGTAAGTLPRVWPALSSEQRAVLIRLGVHRYAREGTGDTAVLAPLVNLSVCHGQQWEVDKRGRLSVDIQVRHLVLAWLRGLADEHAGANPLRQAVRDAVLNPLPAGDDTFAVETITLLGPDLNARAESYLRRLLEKESRYLTPVVESDLAVWTLAHNSFDLLFEIIETYYLRRHMYGGPRSGCAFLALIHVDAKRALPLIQRLLNQVARADQRGVELEFPDGSHHFCWGTSLTWSWWHESDAIGPQHCIKALAAVESFANHLVMSGTPINQVVGTLLRDCENLAMPGLVVGWLRQQVDSLGAELDCWLAQPEVWVMEHQRCVFASPSERSGLDAASRAHDLRLTAIQLVISAITQHDHGRVEALKRAGEMLSRRVRQHIENQGAETTAGANGHLWAHYLQAKNFQLTWRDGKVDHIDFTPPQQDPIQRTEVENDPDQDREHRLAQIGFHYLGIGDRYSGHGIREDRLESLADDLAFVRDVTDGRSLDGSARRAISRVAVAAVVAYVEARVVFADSDLRWAANNLMDTTLEHDDDDWMTLDAPISTAMVALLHPRFGPVGIDYTRLEQCLIELAEAPMSELGDALGRGLDPLWVQPCNHANVNKRCPHEIAWRTIETAIGNCRWERGETWRKKPSRQGRLEEALLAIPTDQLSLDYLPGPLTACFGAAYNENCVAEHARSLLTVLLDVYRRALTHRATGPIFANEIDKGHRSVAGALFMAAARGDHALLVAHLCVLAKSPSALGAFLRDLSCQATNDVEVRQALPRVWPLVMETVLDLGLPSDEDNYRVALTALIPDVRVSRSEPIVQQPGLDLHPLADLFGAAWPNHAEIMAAASVQWIDPDTLGDLIERWIPVVRGEPQAVDSLIGLARTASLSWQVATGLRWVEKLIGDDCRRVNDWSRRLLDWLVELHSSGWLASSDAIVVHRMVDALAAEGNLRAVALQVELE